MVHQVALRWNCFFCARLPSFCLLLLLFVVRYILYTMQNLFTSVYTDVCYKMSLTCLTYWHQLFFISLSLSICWIVWFSILWGVRITYTISFLAHSHHYKTSMLDFHFFFFLFSFSTFYFIQQRARYSCRQYTIYSAAFCCKLFHFYSESVYI